MRGLIAEVYPSQEWRDKVERMPDDQVVAVYHSFLRRGEFNKPPKPVHKPKPTNPNGEYGVQLTIFDFIKEK